MQVQLEKRGKRIIVSSDGPIPDLRMKVPGAYKTASGSWTVPLLIESCILLREQFGTVLKVSTELDRWARGVINSRESMAKLAASQDASVHVLQGAAPKLHAAMDARPYQRVGARFIADNSATLVADDPGLGKTLIALGGIIESQTPGPFLIVAPKTAADSVWRREILRWLPRKHKPIVVPSVRYQRERLLNELQYTRNTWLIIHPEMALAEQWRWCAECDDWVLANKRAAKRLPCGHEKQAKAKARHKFSYPQLFEREWGAIVVDESHDSLIVRTGLPTKRRRGLELLRLREDGLRVAMSGTPFASKPHQLWGTLNWLDPVGYSAFYRWAELYWTRTGYTGWQIGAFRRERESMLWNSLKDVAIRRTKTEVAEDLPPKMEVGSSLDPTDPDSPIGIWLPMDSKQGAAYESMESTSIAELESGQLDAFTAIEQLTRLKQMACCYGDIRTQQVKVSCERSQFPHDTCELGRHEETRFRYMPQLPSNKFNWLVEALEEWGFPRDPLTKVVVVSFYTGILMEFWKGLDKHFRVRESKPLCTAITGRTPQDERRSIIDGFNRKGGPTIMLLNLRAGGTAITIDSADRMVFLSETGIPDQQLQAEDRIHRVSKPRHCMYYYLRSLGTVDVGTSIVNKELIMDTHRLLDERRGVDYVRHILDLSHQNMFAGRLERSR